MATREQLYAETARFLNEKGAVVGSQHPTAVAIAELELVAAEYALSLHPYNFASQTQRLVVSQTYDPDNEDAGLSGFRYAYVKPALARINWLSTSASERGRVTSALAWQDKGGRILSSLNPLYLDGVLLSFATQAKYGYWPRLFCTGVASLLADRLTGSVTNSRTWAETATNRSLGYLEQAAVWDAQQSPAPLKRSGRWLRSRRGWRGSGEEIR